MGVNTKAYLIMPKILGALLIVPLLFASAVILGMVGGYLAGYFGNFFPGRSIKQVFRIRLHPTTQ